MKLFKQVICATALYFSAASASLAKFSPIDGIQYAVGVPELTASAGSGDIYLQITGPSSYQWIAMGIGSGMANSTIFVMYADGTGNVTLSPRTGVKHVMPLFNPNAQAMLLAGSGISNGVMTANFKYQAEAGLLNLSSTTNGFIGAYKSGPPLNSTDQSAIIDKHDNNTVYTLNLASAQLSDDFNPFNFSSSLSNSTDSTNSTSGSSDGSGSDNSGSDDSGSGDSGSDDGPSTSYVIAHGSILAATMVIILPIGSIILRLFGGVWLHTAIQLFSLAAIITGFGIGVYLAQVEDMLFNCPHTIFGLVIVCLFLVQPLLGLLHHRQYLKLGRRSYFGLGHIWYGRILIICGVINGGLGLQLSANSPDGNIAYSVVAGAMFALYVVVILVTGLKRNRKEKTESRSS